MNECYFAIISGGFMARNPSSLAIDLIPLQRRNKHEIMGSILNWIPSRMPGMMWLPLDECLDPSVAILFLFTACNGLFISRAVNGYPYTRFRAITRVVILRAGTRRKKGKQEKLTDAEQEDHARIERLSKLVFCVDFVHYFLVFIVYSSS